MARFNLKDAADLLEQDQEDRYGPPTTEENNFDLELLERQFDEDYDAIERLSPFDERNEADPFDYTSEHTNEYGFPQTYLNSHSGSSTPVCSQCECHVTPNRGQGTICEACNAEFMRECELDSY